MKNNKSVIIIGIIFLNILVVFTVVQSFLGKTSEYDLAIEEARAYVEQDLCSKAVTKYNEAVVIEDSLDLRLEIISAYKKGLATGEFTETYSIFSEINTIVDTYSKEPAVYEAAAEIFLAYEDYENSANLLMKARDLNVTSEKIEEYRNSARYQYSLYYCMYSEVMPTFNDMYAVVQDDVHIYLDKEGSKESIGEFVNASSFSEEFAFVTVQNTDGTQKNVLINKAGERQAYFDSVESSSGVGKAKDAEGNEIYLLACKSGDKYSYYDINGKLVFGEYAFAGRFRNNLAAVKTADGKWQIIDGSGKPISDTTFSDVILNEFDECAPKGLIIAKDGASYHIYDMTLKQVGDFSCDYAKAFVDDYAAFKRGERWGFVAADGTVVIEPQYEDAKSFSNSMGSIKVSDGWQFINAKNEIVIQDVFEDVDYLSSNGICFVKIDGSWSYLKMYYTGK